MAAPKGNQFWKLRSKHGRDKLFATPSVLWRAACEYFEWCDTNPWIKYEPIKSGAGMGTILNVPTQRPYSLSGFCLYCGCSEKFWWAFKKRDCYAEFADVIVIIEKTIETQQFEGATVGAFNANIIARKLAAGEERDEQSRDARVKLYVEVVDEATKSELLKLG